jgi:hypothetical protein
MYKTCLIGLIFCLFVSAKTNDIQDTQTCKEMLKTTYAPSGYLKSDANGRVSADAVPDTCAGAAEAAHAKSADSAGKVPDSLCLRKITTPADSLTIDPIDGIVNIAPTTGHAYLNITAGSGYMKNAFLYLNGTSSYIKWYDQLHFVPDDIPECMAINSGGDTTVYVNYKLRVPWITNMVGNGAVKMDTVTLDSMFSAGGYNTTGNYYKNGVPWKPDSCAHADSSDKSALAVLADSATGAVRAAKLTTARTIGGVPFDGTANIIPDTCKRSGTTAVADSSGKVPVNYTAGIWNFDSLFSTSYNTTGNY